MTNIYIGGDSFCYYRNDYDWPGLVGKLLNAQIHGAGFPGDTWWFTRKNLIEYLSTSTGQATEIFVFCHTDPYRPLIGQKMFKNLEAEVIKEVYFKYFVDYDISLWTTRQWYIELNRLLQNKKVLHFQSFASSKEIFKTLNGIRVITPLVTLSLNDASVDFMNDPRRNHFDLDHNKRFAEIVVDCLGKEPGELEISF